MFIAQRAASSTIIRIWMLEKLVTQIIGAERFMMNTVMAMTIISVM